jgi:hypothetical protein
LIGRRRFPTLSICWIVAFVLQLFGLTHPKLFHPLPPSLLCQLTTHPPPPSGLRNMLSRASRGAANRLSKPRPFSSSAPASAVSPYRRAAQAASARTTTEAAKRPKSTTAATATHDRPVPSPAFNRDDTRWRDVQPLRPYRPQEMDHTFVGMTGGEIFHEMMLRQGVKHICMCSIASLSSL